MRGWCGCPLVFLKIWMVYNEDWEPQTANWWWAMERYSWENGKIVTGLKASKTSLEMTVSLLEATLGRRTENKGAIQSLTIGGLGKETSLTAIQRWDEWYSCFVWRPYSPGWSWTFYVAEVGLEPNPLPLLHKSCDYMHIPLYLVMVLLKNCFVLKTNLFFETGFLFVWELTL